MKTYGLNILVPDAVRDMKRIAAYGTADGTATSEKYLSRCRAYHTPTGTMLIYSRDVYHHMSGWWKNPDYERCLHLSLSFRDPDGGERAPRDKRLTREWLGHFFGSDVGKLWCEPPYSPEGKAADVWHYRLFCAPNWTPIIPRKEVYTTEFTELGWKSFSDVSADLDAEQARIVEIAGNAFATGGAQ